MTRKIALLNAIAKAGIATLGEEYEITQDANEAQAWIVRSKNLHDMDLPEGLRAIGRAGAGVNNIPIDRCSEQGIVVFNAPGANANAVSELVIATAILASRNVVGGVNWVRDLDLNENIAETTEKGKKAFVGTEIKHKTMGVLGLGSVGHLVANAAIGMGMEVVGYDPAIPVQFAWQLSRRVRQASSMEEVLRQADFLSIHIPLNDKTRHIIGAKELAMMKESAILLNFARDQLCDEDAVLEALKANKLRRYVVDFPNEKNVTFPNTIVTPHIGASTDESQEQCAVMVAQELKDYLEHGIIKNSVNFPSVSLGYQEQPTRLIIIHHNKPNAITEMSTFIGKAGYNIDKMISDSRKNYAVAILDINQMVSREFIMDLLANPLIIKIRVLHKE